MSSQLSVYDNKEEYMNIPILHLCYYRSYWQLVSRRRQPMGVRLPLRDVCPLHRHPDRRQARVAALPGVVARDAGRPRLLPSHRHRPLVLHQKGQGDAKERLLIYVNYTNAVLDAQNRNTVVSDGHHAERVAVLTEDVVTK